MKKKLKGGDTGTDGDFDTLASDIGAVISSTVSTIEDAVKLLVDVIELPFDAGKAYSEPASQLLQ